MPRLHGHSFQVTLAYESVVIVAAVLFVVAADEVGRRNRSLAFDVRRAGFQADHVRLLELQLGRVFEADLDGPAAFAAAGVVVEIDASTNASIRSRAPLLNSTGVFDLRNSDCERRSMAPMSLTACVSGLNRPLRSLLPRSAATRAHYHCAQVENLKLDYF